MLEDTAADLMWHEYGDAGLLVEVRADDYETSWRATQRLGRMIRQDPPVGLVDVVASYQDVYISFNPLLTTHDEIRQAMTTGEHTDLKPQQARRFIVPVVYGGAHGRDLESVAAALGDSVDAIIERHLSDDWIVRFIGSPLGAPMMDGPRMRSSVPRLENPRALVPPGSVAISGFQSMIYNAPSPGGWRLIGRTPVRLFDLDAPPHVPYRAGDRIRFDRIAEVDWDRRRSLVVTPVDLDGEPGMITLDVERAGLAVFQDLGRPGRSSIGVATNGAADAGAARIANILVGNRDAAPVVEITDSEFAFRPRTEAMVAITGAADRVFVDGSDRPARTTLLVPAGARIVVPSPSDGVRSYLAINGVIDAPTALGSVSPDPQLGLGTRILAGDTISVVSRYTTLPAGRDAPFFRLHGSRDRVEPVAHVFATTGPDLGRLADGRGCLAGEFQVSPQSNQVGLRLEGPAPAHNTADEILSRGVPVGAVEAPPSGGIIVLLRGRLVTAGYPVIAVVTSDCIDRLGQVRPGDRVRFELCEIATARDRLRAQESEIASLAARVRRAFTSSELAHVLDPDHGMSTSRG